MSLLNRLLQLDLITGTLPATSNTSNSSMGSSKTFLLGLPQFQGDEKYLIFGRVLHDHLQFIEDDGYRSADYQLLTKHEQESILNILIEVRKHKVVAMLLHKSVREQKLYLNIDGVRTALILDLEQPHNKTGSDWKSTACNSLEDFIGKAINYDYIRQGCLYCKARNLKHFYFIGLNKKPPHAIYLMDISNYPDEIRYAHQEIKFLQYFYTNYGKIKIPGKPLPVEQATQKTITIMAKVETKGLAALKAIADQHKATKAAIKDAEKQKVNLGKLIGKFPKKEVELYQEKLSKFTLEA